VADSLSRVSAPPFRTASFRTLHPVGDGVFAWLQPGGESGVSNAGVVVDDDGLTVIDTMMVRSQWEPFAEAIAELDLPVKRVLLTHAHVDHVGGTTMFRNAMILGSPTTSALLDQPMPLDAYKAFMPAFAEEFDELEELGTRPVSHLVDDAAQLTARVEVLPATGHTSGDLMVLVADADVLFAGDLCFFGVTPLAFQGDPATWADTLEVLADLADTIVPGHGPIGDAEDVRDLQAYLRHCVAGAVPPGPWDRWLERDRDAINVEKAAMLRGGDDGMPPSMLRAIGLG
jgi:cyclase